MIEKKEIKLGRIDQMDRSEVEARLNALLDKNQLIPGLQSAVVDDSVMDVEEAEFEEPVFEPLDGEGYDLDEDDYESDEEPSADGEEDAW